jgi:uncharacterized protein YbbC (DUF1343 family)
VSGDYRLSRTARLGLLTNRSARTSARSGSVWSRDALREAGYTISLLLTPEHGLDLAAAAGEPVPHSRHANIPVLSLYGADPFPLDEALSEIEELVIDLPDVGCRYYTYPWTVRELLRKAAERGLPVTLLDRPNPLGGAIVEGNVPDPGFDSPVCASPVPVRHGLTMGELALWNRRAHAIDVNLSVVPMKGWRRELLWTDMALTWAPPSPALPRFCAARVYPGTCLFEGTNISEGRGTDTPFETVGAPFVDPLAVLRSLERSELLAGANVRCASFTPTSSKWEGAKCLGVRIDPYDLHVFRPVAAGIALVASFSRESDFVFGPSRFDALAGTTTWRQALERFVPPEEIINRWQQGEARYLEERREILLYT